eukprot:s1750_g11.t1
MHINPMGSSAQQVKAGILLPYSDEACGTKPMNFSVTPDAYFPKDLGKMLLWTVRDPYPTSATWKPQVCQDLHIHWQVDELTQVLLLEDKPGPFRHLELFSGGHGGWGFASRFIRKFCNAPSQIIAIEHDLATLAPYAIHHGSMVVSGEHALPAGLIESGLDLTIHEMSPVEPGCPRLQLGVLT